MSTTTPSRTLFYLPDELTADELVALLRPLRREYARLVAATAYLGGTERAAVALARVEAYGAALSATLCAALDDATALERGGQR